VGVPQGDGAALLRTVIGPLWLSSFNRASEGGEGGGKGVRRGRGRAAACAIGDSDLIMSALAPFADSSRTSPEVREVPIPDSCDAANRDCHSITSSATCWRCGGTSSPSALAVLRLMKYWNLVGCSTGSSLGLEPFSTFSTKTAAR
jgi:hypothetical protein